MFIERYVFSKAHPDFDRLLAYGFTRQHNIYRYSKEILADGFRAEITVSAQGEVNGRVMDLTTDEEYANIHIRSHQGEFVNRVREAYTALLTDIRDRCFVQDYFSGAQANRLIRLIYARYGDQPDFPWEKYPDYAVFRHPANRKWYGLILTIERGKLNKKQKGIANVLNLKVDETRLKDLLKKSGVYPAYHMNKKSWVSIVLDDSLIDRQIMELLECSHQLALQGKGGAVRTGSMEWIVPANPKYFDVEQAFREKTEITWKQSNHIAVGDIVFMYVAAPRSAILYKCEVTEVLIPYTGKHPHLKINHLMRIKLLQQYPPDLLPFKRLKEYGINAVRGPRSMPPAFSRAIDTMLQS